MAIEPRRRICITVTLEIPEAQYQQRLNEAKSVLGALATPQVNEGLAVAATLCTAGERIEHAMALAARKGEPLPIYGATHELGDSGGMLTVEPHDHGVIERKRGPVVLEA